MSFGCSPSDVLKLLEFSTRVYLAFKDANENSEAQVAGLVKEFTAFHTCLVELGELMKQYGQPMPFPVKEFEATLKRCEKTLDPYADHLVDKKMGVKKFIFTIRYMGMEKEIDGLRKQITGHYQALHMCISFLQLRLHLEATKQTQRLLDAAPPRTVTLGGRAYSTSALGFSSQHTPLSLPAPDEHPLFSEWVIFDRWLQSEDERIAREAEHSRPLSLGDTPAALPSDDDQTAAILYHLRRQVDDAILIEENRTKRMTAEKRSHLSPSDAIRQEVRNMPPAPSRTYTLDTDHSGNFTGFGQHQMSSSSETARPSLSIPLSHSPPSVGPRGDSYFGSIDWAQSPTDTSASYDAGRTSVSTNRSSMSHSPGSQPRSSSADLSPGGTIPETLASYSLRRSLSRTSLATMALGEAALDWKRICRSVEVERKSVKYGAESRDCDVRWRYREDTGISIRAVYHSSQDGKLRTWIEQHFPATGPSIPLTTTYPDGAVSIDFPRNSFGKLDKQYTDIKYTFSASDSAEKFQTLLYTNNSADAADLKFDRPILTISSDKNPTECRGRNLRLWHRTETHLEDDGPVAFDVLVLLFYTSALEERGHWVEEPHYAFEWLTDACMKKESEKLTLVFSKDASRWKSDKLFQRRKSSGASTVAVPRSPASPSSSSSFFSPRKRNDSMEIPQLTRAGTKASVASNESFKTALTSAAHPGRLGNLNRFGYSELEIKFQSKKDRRAFLEVWAEFVKPLR
ncbi:hypothetical protein GGP41_002356 [Bipolaris sorokiniana]|uniref:Uncharacterized protein n=2 Tax=Cochliobolus sativus TaxID=45130 RepID=A0A8H5ZIY6_COCSA|nr:uncharacterized protein COCSADRAFT_183295 [Bipolaris sorokiniana ND90Pr]EMD62187.1 hypothetical protein COCSADRAFT_183295 [Bipolaris sorokiniana ND90Pr]KAF5850117.1 hypothetical protein GGP41_002356 [Bipolaris sorokiniana]